MSNFFWVYFGHFLYIFNISRQVLLTPLKHQKTYLVYMRRMPIYNYFPPYGLWKASLRSNIPTVYLCSPSKECAIMIPEEQNQDTFDRCGCEMTNSVPVVTLRSTSEVTTLLDTEEKNGNQDQDLVKRNTCQITDV